MYPDDCISQPQAPPLKVIKCARSVRWQLVWLLVMLLVAGVVTGVSVASVTATDPDWDGTDPMDISNSPTDKAQRPVIAAGLSGRMVVAWSEGAKPDIYATSSYDYGRSWSGKGAIAATAEASWLPDVVIVGESDRAFVVWVDDEPPSAIYEAEIGSGGVRRISPPPSQALSGYMRPRLAAGAARLHVVFSAGAGPDIFYAMRPLAASAWPTATIIHTHTAAYGSQYPTLAVVPGGETLHVVWEEATSVKIQTIMYMSGTVNGMDVNWTSAITLSTGITLSVRPAIAADSEGNLHVVWGEKIEGAATDQDRYYVCYRRYDAAVGQWTPIERIDPDYVTINTDIPKFTTPSLALLEGEDTVCVAWHGFREGASEDAEEILLTCSRDGGQSWPSPQNVSRSPGVVPDETDISVLPSITFDASGLLHGVWEEHNDSTLVTPHAQVYYSHAQHIVYLPLVMRSG